MRSLRTLRIKQYPQTGASRLREALQRLSRWTHLAALDLRVGLRRLHASSELRLRQARRRTRSEQCPREVELFTQSVVLSHVSRWTSLSRSRRTLSDATLASSWRAATASAPPPSWRRSAIGRGRTPRPEHQRRPCSRRPGANGDGDHQSRLRLFLRCRCAADPFQSSTFNPGARWNSLVLWVTSVNSRALA